MLSANEFTVGALADAAPLSLILPCARYDETILVGFADDEPAAVFLSEQYAFRYCPSVDNASRKGLIVPQVRVEVDETSITENTPLGAIIRMDTRLVVRATRDNSFDDGAVVTLQDGLVSTGGHQAAFVRWRIVIGDGMDKRILWQV
ncbi:MAG: hypothetical protein QM767_02980, partial [Anaeromyxobacter sp.]